MLTKLLNLHVCRAAQWICIEVCEEDRKLRHRKWKYWEELKSRLAKQAPFPHEWIYDRRVYVQPILRKSLSHTELDTVLCKSQIMSLI